MNSGDEGLEHADAVKAAFRGRRVVVTGGAGFIGSEVVRQLHDAGATVCVVDNLTNGRRANLEPLAGGPVELRIADIRDPAAMAAALAGAKCVLHLACLGVRHSIHSPQENHDVNASGTLRLLCAAREARVPRFVCVSSSEVYGTARTTPMTEDHPTYPCTVYGASKLAGECYARAFHETHGDPVVIVRPFNAYGPRCHHEGDSGEVIPKFMLRALAGEPLIVFGDGWQSRDFTFVSDTAAGILQAAACPQAVGRTINLGSGQETTILDLAHLIREVTASASPIVHQPPRPGDVGRLIADAGTARTLLGYRPRVSLHDGLLALRDWYLQLKQRPADLLREEIPCNWLCKTRPLKKPIHLSTA